MYMYRIEEKMKISVLIDLTGVLKHGTKNCYLG